ncbi:hypothetical protein BJ742DRAFT_794817 [Cladochytrium replicatum]|nr:hypothetical protein BJ742DRAFT_794817 [Cladochytrium replicatum]
MPSYIAAIDQGTSSTRFIVFDLSAKVVAIHQTEFEQIYPEAGWAEHNPATIMDTVQECMVQVAKDMEARGLDPKDVKAIGVTNQRETTVVWDRITGAPLHNAIVWLDARTKSTVDELAHKTPSGKKEHWAKKCGTPLSTYFSGVKLRWLLDNVDSVALAHKEGRLLFGTIDSWLIYNLSGGVNAGVHVTDVTNASRTMLMNIETLQWDDELLSFFGVNRDALPEIRSSAEVYAHVKGGPFAGVPISGCLGDQQAALVGHQCFTPGEVKNTYGTGCFMLYNTGEAPVYSKNGLLTTVGYQLGKSAKPVYALEGSISIAGFAVKWLRANLGFFEDSSEINVLAGRVKDTGGVYFVPAFGGLFAPHWRDDARGCIVGLTQYTTKDHISRAALEAVCFQSREVIDAMNSDSGGHLSVIKVDGGMTNSDLTMQIQADLLGINVERPEMREMTALGTALAAGLAVGLYPSISDKDLHFSYGRQVFSPKVGVEERESRFAEWKKAVERSLGWVSD